MAASMFFCYPSSSSHHQCAMYIVAAVEHMKSPLVFHILFSINQIDWTTGCIQLNRLIEKISTSNIYSSIFHTIDTDWWTSGKISLTHTHVHQFVFNSNIIFLNALHKIYWLHHNVIYLDQFDEQFYTPCVNWMVIPCVLIWLSRQLICYNNDVSVCFSDILHHINTTFQPPPNDEICLLFIHRHNRMSMIYNVQGIFWIFNTCRMKSPRFKCINNNPSD